jgi:polyisoprenoid-binding protein YceI
MTAPAATTNAWKLDASHTSVEFSAKHMMLTTVKGRFGELEGTVDINGTTPDSAIVRATMKVASIDTRNEQRDGHLRSADFLDAESFPDLTFVSTKIGGTKERFTITGDLTIRGTTKSVTLDVTNEGTGIDPWGGERRGFSADTKIDRREFGLTYNQVLEAGGVLVGNEIKIHIEAQLVRA